MSRFIATDPVIVLKAPKPPKPKPRKTARQVMKLPKRP